MEDALKTRTKYFGEIDYEENEILHFSKGLFGFEDEHRFLLINFSEEGSLLCFQSLATPGLAFVAMNPFTLLADYAPVLQPEELEELKVSDSHDLHYFTLCVAKDPVGDSTVNLKCPVAVNENTREAMQVILQDGPYDMRHKLSEFGKQEDVPC